MAPTSPGVGNLATTLSSSFPCPRQSSLFLPDLRSFMEEPFLYSREVQSPIALWSNFRRFREIEGWGCRPEAGFSEGDGATVIFALGKGVGRATFLCARSWLSRPLCKIRPHLEFPIPPYLPCKLRPPLKPSFSSFCFLAKMAPPGRFWMNAGMKVKVFSGKMVCLSSMKKDLPLIKIISCLKYGCWMIRHVPMFETGACLLLELSPRSCLKLNTYGFRSVIKFMYSDVFILFLGNVQSLVHPCSSVVFVLEQWNLFGFVFVPGFYLGMLCKWNPLF